MLVILVVLCPPLAVLITAGPVEALKNCGLSLLLYVPGVVHARSVVDQYRVTRRYNTLMQLLETRTQVPAQPRAA